MIKYFLIVTIVLSSLSIASSSKKSNKERKSRIEKQIQKEIQKEKKYAREQTFYSAENYDFKSAQVNPDSLDSVPDLEPQYDFDMDSVYD